MGWKSGWNQIIGLMILEGVSYEIESSCQTVGRDYEDIAIMSNDKIQSNHLFISKENYYRERKYNVTRRKWKGGYLHNCWKD